MYLVIVEISQKQAYIFASNKLSNNIQNSENICYVTSDNYFSEKTKGLNLYDKKNNMVYSGGGHTVLKFDTEENAKKFANYISKEVRNDYDGIEYFIKILKYEDDLTPSENHKKLIDELEKKKSLRKSAFKHESFGIEKVDNQSFKPKKIITNKHIQKNLDSDVEKNSKYVSVEKIKKYLPEKQAEIFGKYKTVSEFNKLGGSKNESNFIAVVHIDGNAMGARVADLKNVNKNLDKNLDEFTEIMGNFSEEIDKNFKQAYYSMVYKIILNIENGNLSELKLDEKTLPIRKIITAGDDICFVCDGRIGLEAASIFLKELSKITNNVDKKGYSACAGVCIVHTKFPFYRAYEISESLCSNSKVFINKFGKNANISAIDWHIEFGEIKSSLSEIKAQYITQDNNRLDLRPLIVTAESKFLEKEKIRIYDKFKKLIDFLKNNDEFARGKIKQLREILHYGEKDSYYYIESNRINDILFTPINEIFKETEISEVINEKKQFKQTVFLSFNTDNDEFKRCIIFDAIELLDTFISINHNIGGDL